MSNSTADKIIPKVSKTPVQEPCAAGDSDINVATTEVAELLGALWGLSKEVVRASGVLAHGTIKAASFVARSINEKDLRETATLVTAGATEKSYAEAEKIVERVFNKDTTVATKAVNAASSEVGEEVLYDLYDQHDAATAARSKASKKIKSIDEKLKTESDDDMIDILRTARDASIKSRDDSTALADKIFDSIKLQISTYGLDS